MSAARLVLRRGPPRPLQLFDRHRARPLQKFSRTIVWTSRDRNIARRGGVKYSALAPQRVLELVWVQRPGLRLGALHLPLADEPRERVFERERPRLREIVIS